MQEVETRAALRAWREAQRRAGRRVGFVPTMGFLHEGHLALVDEARRRADVVAMSIFVNPLQFGPAEDFARYPRDLARDRALAAGRGVDLLFVPSREEMYPAGDPATRVVPGEAAARLEGAVRPGHFAGVLTVVAKLFHLVEPDVACFGQKDIQQALLLRAMVRDLDWPLELVVVPTVREPDGLALSSRNVYLAPAERAEAIGLWEALRAAADRYEAGERRTEALVAAMRAAIAARPMLVADYIAVVEPDGLADVDVAHDGCVAAVAARVGRTRLIDNVILGARR